MQKAASVLFINKIPYDNYEFLGISQTSCAKMAASSALTLRAHPSWWTAHLKDENNWFMLEVTKEIQIGF